jgi:predicted dehydrogenase
MNPTSISRRAFVKSTMSAAGVLAMGELPNAKALGANDRINMGCIGVGTMGSIHLDSLIKRSEADNIKVAAVCDVYQRRVTTAKDKCKGEGYLDYRKLLDRKDIDAVLIATPDHWHSKISLDAMDAGKHVYCEKPMTYTCEQAIELRDAVKRSKKVFQVGPQATGSDFYWKAHDAIKAGQIGKVTWAQGSYNRNARVCLFNVITPEDPNAGPDKTGEDFIDWDMWLGHKWGLAPKIPWNPQHFFHFRKFWPYNGGVATDLLYHKLAPLLLAIVGPDGEYPLRVNASGGLYIEKDGRDIPDVFIMTADYPSEFTILLVSVLTNDTQMPERIYGKHGTMEMGTPERPREVIMQVNGDFKEEFKAKNDGKLENYIPITDRRDMEGNFFDVIRGNGTVHCNANLGAATMVAIKMAVESYRQKKTMLWDAKNEKVVS